MDKIKEQVESQIEEIGKEGISTKNLEYLDKLVDIKKDLCEIKKMEEEKMDRGAYDNYSNYGNYGNDYGRGYRESGEYNDGYGRRGRDIKYRGEHDLDSMRESYREYRDTSGSYGAGPESKKSLKYMLEAMEDFAKKLMQEAGSREETEMVRETARKIANM